jgi:ribosome-associated protein
MAPETTTVIEVGEVSLAKAYLTVQASANKKAENIKVLDLKNLSSFTEYFVICSGTSDRQVQAIADSIIIELKEEGFLPVAVEGYREGRWVIVDYGDMVAHIFHDALREFYDLENLWNHARKVPIPQELFITSIEH